MSRASTRTTFTRPSPRLFTVDEYEAMGAAGILHEDERVELIRGVIVEMSPIGGPHMWAVAKAYDVLSDRLRGRARLFSQSPIRLADSEPGPDVFVARPDVEPNVVPYAKDVLLVIEVADTTLAADLAEKVPLYAENGIPETWVCEVNLRRIHVFRDLREGAYATALVVGAGQTVALLAFPDVAIGPSDLLS